MRRGVEEVGSRHLLDLVSRSMTTWGAIYHRALSRGEDNGYAAHLADQWEKRMARSTNKISVEIDLFECDEKEILEFVQKNYDPEDVFQKDELTKWATNEGFVLAEN